MGLQFFSDKEAGLREIQRVLVGGGRLVANLPGPTPSALEAMAESLAEHISPASRPSSRGSTTRAGPRSHATMPRGARVSCRTGAWLGRST